MNTTPWRARLATVAALAAILAFGPTASAIAVDDDEPDPRPMISATSTPTLEGARTVGSTLTVTPVTWDVEGVTVRYEWAVSDGCCAVGDLPDTGTTHTITPEDSYAGFVGVTIIASKDGYQDGYAFAGSGRIIANTPPAPVASTLNLTAANRGLLTISRSGSSAIISIPGTGPGIQFYVYEYYNGSPSGLGFFVTNDPDGEFRPAYELEVNADGLAPGVHRLAVLKTNGDLIGWVDLGSAPLAPPVASSSGLTAANNGGATGTPSTGNTTTIDVPGAVPGQSTFVTGFSTPTPIGWYLVDGNRQIHVDFSMLPPGRHKLAISSVSGELLGWVAVTARDLAATGRPVDVIALGSAGALLVLGLALLALARRRRVA